LPAVPPAGSAGATAPSTAASTRRTKAVTRSHHLAGIVTAALVIGSKSIFVPHHNHGRRATRLCGPSRPSARFQTPQEAFAVWFAQAVTLVCLMQKFWPLQTAKRAETRCFGQI
jgi:hypothetical protein